MRLHRLPADFQVVPTANVRDITTDSPIQQSSRLGNDGLRVQRWIRAGVILDSILTNKRIDCQECGRAERMLITRSEIERYCLLTLIRAKGIQSVGNLEPVAGQKEIGMYCIFIVWQVVQTVKGIFVISNCVNRIEFRRIKESAGSQPISSNEPPEFWSSQPQGGRKRRSTEGTVLR